MAQALGRAAGYPPVSGVLANGPLQPEAASEKFVPLRVGDLAKFPEGPEWKSIEEEVERLQRRLNDAKMLTKLRADGFKGEAYDRFRTELARYAWGIMQAWLHSGFIFDMCGRRGFYLRPSSQELEVLERNRDERTTLANMAVGVTMPEFEEGALRNGGWRFDGGASINTYFMGLVPYYFPNLFRAWQDERKYLPRTVIDPSAVVGSGADLHRAVEALIEHDVPGLKKAEIDLLLLDALEYSYAEIAERHGISVRAVEGRLARARKKAQQLYRGRRPS